MGSRDGSLEAGETSELSSDSLNHVPDSLSPPYSLYTFGCKLNQLESEAIADAFRKAGFSFIPWGAATDVPGILIINTCTVTSKADQKARRLIRKALRENPESCVIAAGCYARLDPADIESLEQGTGGAGFRRLFVLGKGDCEANNTSGAQGAGAVKGALLDLPGDLREALSGNELTGEWLSQFLDSWIAYTRGDSPFRFMPDEFTFHSRGYLKIQDGCDNNCTYCRVRLARGTSVSMPKEAVLAQLRSFEESGCAEMMVTGVNISQYKDGTGDSGCDLASLLEYLLEGSAGMALRLSSLEPECITERLARVLAHPRIRPHFHISMQSGSDAVLRVMGRVYTAEALERGAALLRSVKDNPFLACDIIAGFPGESEAEFARTLSICEKIRFAWIHVFPYSRRPGTAAFSLGNAVSDKDISRRVQVLASLALRGRREYAQSWLGRELTAIVERSKPNDAVPPGVNQCRAVSGNYLKLLVNSADGDPLAAMPPVGSSLRCVPVSLCDNADGENPDAVAVIAR